MIEAANEYVLFCDDDLFLERAYDVVCLQKLQSSNVAAVSGRHLFRLPGECPDHAIRRFGHGLRRRPPFRWYTCAFVDDAYYEGDIRIPMTNACILTKKALIDEYGFDSFYKNGTGYREESDFQMQLYVNGLDILVTNEVHAVHLHRTETASGGSRVNRLKRVFWGVYYTNYFYKKYWDRYARRAGLRWPRLLALTWFTIYFTYSVFIRPLRHFLPARLRRAILRYEGSSAVREPVRDLDT